MSGKNIDKNNCYKTSTIFQKEIFNSQKILYKKECDTIWVVLKNFGEKYKEKFINTKGYWLSENHYYVEEEPGKKVDYGTLSERKIIRNDTLFMFFWNGRTCWGYNVKTKSKSFFFPSNLSPNQLMKMNIDTLIQNSYTYTVTFKVNQNDCVFIENDTTYIKGKKKYNKVTSFEYSEYYRDRLLYEGTLNIKQPAGFESLLPK